MARPPSKIVFVGNIPYGLSEEQITDIFSSAGRVVSFRLVYDRENGKPKGFGFAEYPDSDSAASAVRNLNDFEVMGRKLRVDFSNEGGDEGLAGIPSLAGGPGDALGPNTVGAPSGLSASASAASSLPPLPPGREIPPGASATDEISRVLRTLPPTQLLDILAQMKTLAANDPARAIELLAQAPQLAYAVFQALLLMDLVSPDAIHSVVDSSSAAGLGALAGMSGMPGMAGMVGLPIGAPQPASAQAGAFPYGAYVPEAVPAPAAPQPPAAPQQDDLIKQVLELPQAVIDQLPENERKQLMALRMQYGVGVR